MNKIPTVNDKDTKGAIIEKFNTVVAMLKDQASTKLDPAKEVAQKAVIATLEKAEAISSSDINFQINEITEVVTTALCDALSGINTRVADYKELDNAIALKKAELNDLFGIEAGAFALIALINMQEEAKTAFETEKAKEEEEALAKLQAIISETEERRSALKTEMAEKQKELEATRKREADEYKYNLDRSRKIEEDQREDEKAADLKIFNQALDLQREALNDFDEEVNERAEKVSAREAVIDELQAKVDEIPHLIEVAIAKTAKDVKASADTSNGFETRYLKKEAESAAALAAAQIKTLQEALEAEKARTISLEAKLDTAYEKIESISGKAVEAAAGAQYVNRMESNFKEQGKQITSK